MINKITIYKGTETKSWEPPFIDEEKKEVNSIIAELKDRLFYDISRKEKFLAKTDTIEIWFEVESMKYLLISKPKTPFLLLSENIKKESTTKAINTLFKT